MENQNPKPNNHPNQINTNNNNSNNNYSRKGSDSHISISDTESTPSQLDSFHSPLRSNSPLPLSPSLSPTTTTTTTSTALVPVDKPISGHLSYPITPIVTPNKGEEVVYNYNRGGGVKEGVRKVERRDEELGGGGGGGERKARVAVGSILRRSKREVVLKRAALGFRVFEIVVCLVSFSVMAADKTQGWAGDSFDRYKEYRYCLAMNVIGFVYAGFQAIDLSFNLASGKHIISHHLRYHFEFLMDQILAYLLMSASSSAATRVDDWVTNWGKDTFTDMATASVGMSFLAFFAFAISSLISGYNLCNQDWS